MNVVELYKLLEPKTFRPVRVHLNEGRSYNIPLRQLAMVGESWLDIGIPEPGETEAIADSFVSIPLTAIAKVEILSVPWPQPF